MILEKAIKEAIIHFNRKNKLAKAEIFLEYKRKCYEVYYIVIKPRIDFLKTRKYIEVHADYALSDSKPVITLVWDMKLDFIELNDLGERNAIQAIKEKLIDIFKIVVSNDISRFKLEPHELEFINKVKEMARGFSIAVHKYHNGVIELTVNIANDLIEIEAFPVVVKSGIKYHINKILIRLINSYNKHKETLIDLLKMNNIKFALVNPSDIRVDSPDMTILNKVIQAVISLHLI